jgi:hypothetical protein
MVVELLPLNRYVKIFVIIRQYPASLDQLYTLFSLNFGEQSSPSVVINNIVALLNYSKLNETIRKKYDTMRQWNTIECLKAIRHQEDLSGK